MEKPILMTKKEILALSSMIFSEQIDWLCQNKVMKHKHIDGNLHLGESLADCAFRLRDEVYKESSSHYVTLQWFKKFMFQVSDKVHGIKDLNEKDSVRFWLSEAQPIHWIQACLLAKGGEG